MRIANLPPDMQQLLADMSGESGHAIWESEDGLKRFLETDLALVELPPDAFPDIKRRDIDVEDRPVEPYIEADPRDFPPVLVAHGQFLDGRHRVWAARVRRDPMVKTLDASRVIRPEYAHIWGMGSLNEAAIEVPEENGSTRQSLKNAALLIVKHGLPEYILLKSVGDRWGVKAQWGPLEYWFDGFAWGFGGEGPRGLATLFEMMGAEPPITTKEVASWPMPGGVKRRQKRGWGVKAWSPPVWQKGFARGREYGKDWE